MGNELTNKQPDLAPKAAPEKKVQTPAAEKEKQKQAAESKTKKGLEGVDRGNDERKANDALKEAQKEDQQQKEGEETQTKTPTEGNDWFGGIMSNFERVQNSLAYHLAPIMESLGSIPFIANDGTVSMLQEFLGMDRTMLFASLRKQGITIDFDAKDSGKDATAITELLEMANNLHTINSGYSRKQFFNAVAKRYKEECDLKGKIPQIPLSDLSTFASTNVLEKEKEAAQGLPVKAAAGVVPPELAGQAPSTLKIAATATGGVSIEKGAEKTVVEKAANGTVLCNGKAWKLRTTSALTSLFTGGKLPIESIRPDGNSVYLTVNANGKKEGTLPPEILSGLLEHIQKNTPFAFEFEGYNLSFEPA